MELTYTTLAQFTVVKQFLHDSFIFLARTLLFIVQNSTGWTYFFCVGKVSSRRLCGTGVSYKASQPSIVRYGAIKNSLEKMIPLNGATPRFQWTHLFQWTTAIVARIPLNDRSKMHSYERNWTTPPLFASFPVSSYYSRYTRDAN